MQHSPERTNSMATYKYLVVETNYKTARALFPSENVDFPHPPPGAVTVVVNTSQKNVPFFSFLHMHTVAHLC